jgi:CrcB protein
MNLVLIFIGGGLGSLARFGLARITTNYFPPSFPYGTLAVNAASCFILGMILGISMDKYLVSPNLKLFVAVGFCGGFSTFSTFTNDIFELIRAGQFVYAGLNIALSLLICLVTLVGGMALSKLI